MGTKRIIASLLIATFGNSPISQGAAPKESMPENKACEGCKDNNYSYVDSLITNPQVVEKTSAPSTPTKKGKSLVLALPDVGLLSSRGKLNAIDAHATNLETLQPGTQINIYPIPGSPKIAACVVGVISPNGETIYAAQVLPIQSHNQKKEWPKISLTLNEEGNYGIKATFLHKNGIAESSSTSLLVKTNNNCESYSNNVESKNASPNKENEGINAQILAQILSSLETKNVKDTVPHRHTKFQPPYSQQEVLTTVENFFNPTAKEKYPQESCAHRAKMMDLAASLDHQEGARWVIQSLPLWNDVEDANPPAQLAKRAAQLARPDDISLLSNLLECEINEGAKLWGLSILSNISNPINTDFLQALVLEASIQNPRGEDQKSWTQGDAALEALARMGSKRAILFLFDILEDAKISDHEKENIGNALLTYLPATEQSIGVLKNLGLMGDESQLISNKILATLINNLEGSVNSQQNLED